MRGCSRASLLRGNSVRRNLTSNHRRATHGCADSADFVAEADVKHGLGGILNEIDDLARRGAQVKMRAVGEQVVLGGGANGGGEAGAEFSVEKRDHFAHALERESAAAQLGYDGGGYELIPGIDAAMALAAGRYEAALVPPLELATGDAGERDDLGGGELPLHFWRVVFQTKSVRNV